MLREMAAGTIEQLKGREDEVENGKMTGKRYCYSIEKLMTQVEKKKSLLESTKKYCK